MAARVLLMVGALAAIGAINGIVGGTLTHFWGDRIGCLFGDFASGLIAIYTVWEWTGRQFRPA